jgi:hypothetical protein
MTEGRAPQALTIGGIDGEALFPPTSAGPLINVHFIGSDGDGRLPAGYVEDDSAPTIER